MTRSVQKVEFMPSVRKVERRRGDGDAALLLHLHPVGRSRASSPVCLHCTAGGDGSRIQQELLGQRRFARVGVADDRERPSARGLAGHLFGHSFEATAGIESRHLKCARE